MRDPRALVLLLLLLPACQGSGTLGGGGTLPMDDDDTTGADDDDDATGDGDEGTGEFVMLAEGLPAPNGVSFSPDWNTVYVNSFGGGTVSSIPLSPEGAAGPAVLYGNTSGGTAPPWGLDPWSDACDGAGAGPSTTASPASAVPPATPSPSGSS